MKVIEAHAGRGDAKRVGRPAIHIGIERHENVLGLVDPFVTPAHGRLNAGGICTEHPRAHDERILVEHDSHFQRIRRRHAFVGLCLNEVSDRGGRQPYLFVQSSIDPHRSCGDSGRDDLLSLSRVRRLGLAQAVSQNQDQQKDRQRTVPHASPFSTSRVSSVSRDLHGTVMKPT
jgi:hypothetical protein